MSVSQQSRQNQYAAEGNSVPNTTILQLYKEGDFRAWDRKVLSRKFDLSFPCPSTWVHLALPVYEQPIALTKASMGGYWAWSPGSFNVIKFSTA
jgi:hypothetical protein